jgi:hypothetical protein
MPRRKWSLKSLPINRPYKYILQTKTDESLIGGFVLEITITT